MLTSEYLRKLKPSVDMNPQELKEFARNHWKEFRPKMYAELK
jgi:hypothetical protein